MHDRILQDAINKLERISRRDPGERGLAAHAETGMLYPAARELHSSERVLIVTGFCIRSALIGETDGPPGALALACALIQSGKKVLLVTDDFSVPLLKAAAAVSGNEIPVQSLNLPQTSADAAMDALLSAFSPTHIVAIERPGSAVDGHRYSMRGEILDDLVAAADRLFTLQGQRQYRTLAIGDGGNELGMGSLREGLKHRISQGELIFCATPADHVIPAGISNWGAYALAGALSLLAGKLLLRPPAHERAVLEALVSAGAVDGCTRQQTLSVDGLAWNEYAEVINDIYRKTCNGLTSDSRGHSAGQAG